MNIIMIIFIILFIASAILKTRSSDNAGKGKLLPIKCKYICGISNLQEGEVIILHGNSEVVQIYNLQVKPKYIIPTEKIISKNITSSNMLTEKQKSIIGRSIVGLAVGGGIGAVVGGISGIGTKQKTELIHFITINYKDENDIEQEAMFTLIDTQCLTYVEMFINN